jgi:hypothetical protein
VLRSRLASVAVASVAVASVAVGCDHRPDTQVVLDNDYAPSPTRSLVVYRAHWLAVSFQDPVPPGSSSAPHDTVAASANTAYVLLAPGWDPASATPPASFIVMQSRSGFEVHLDDTLHIPIDDATFLGNCAAGSFLSQAQADFITRLVFPGEFVSLSYDAATCMTTPIGDAGDAGDAGAD